MRRLLIAAVCVMSGCSTWTGWRVPDKAVVDRCLDSNGCWNYRDNVCERADPTRCPDPTPR